MTLYELTGEYRRLYEMADELEGSDFEEATKDTLELLDGDFEDKAEAYAVVIKNLEADVEAIKTEAARLAKRKQVITNNIDALKKRLQNAMIEVGKPKFKTALFSFNIQKNPKRVVMDETDISKIPLDFIVIQMPEVDKKAIKEALTAGADLSGIAHLEQDESLRIR